MDQKCSKETTDANKITIKWVPSHSEISGNDKADDIAKNSSKFTKINDIPYSSNDLRQEIKSDISKYGKTNGKILD